MSELKCEDRIERHYEGRIADLRKLWSSYNNGTVDGELGELHDYGLSFDYVAPGTFDDQREGYFRYQISWGGPSDEFRFFLNPGLSCHRVEYWFLDWFDGACRVCQDDNLTLLLELWLWFYEMGMPQIALKQGRR